MAVLGRSQPNRPIVIRPSSVDTSSSANFAVTATITASGTVTAFATPKPIICNAEAIQRAVYYRTLGRSQPNRPIIIRSSLVDTPGSGSASLIVTDTITAAGSAGQDASLAVTATTTAAGSAGQDASLAVTATFTAAGTVTVFATPMVVVSNDEAIQGAIYYRTLGRGYPNPAFISRASSADAAGSGSVSLIVTDTITAAGSAGQDASLAVTATITAAGTVTAFATPEPVVVTPTWQQAAYYRTIGRGQPVPVVIERSSLVDVAPGTGSASLTVSDTITATGNMAATGSASLPVTVAISPTGGTSGSASLTVTTTITAAGVVTGANSAAVVTTATIIAAGQVTAASGATRPVTVAITATGLIPGNLNAAFAATVSIIAAGHVNTDKTPFRLVGDDDPVYTLTSGDDRVYTLGGSDTASAVLTATNS